MSSKGGAKLKQYKTCNVNNEIYMGDMDMDIGIIRNPLSLDMK